MGSEEIQPARLECFKKFGSSKPENRLVSHSYEGCKEGGFFFFFKQERYGNVYMMMKRLKIQERRDK